MAIYYQEHGEDWGRLFEFSEAVEPASVDFAKKPSEIRKTNPLLMFGIDLSDFSDPSSGIDETVDALNTFDAWHFLRPLEIDLLGVANALDKFGIDLRSEFTSKAINKRQGKKGPRRRNRR